MVNSGRELSADSPEHLLAMKIRASMQRDRDDDDIVLLCEYLDIRATVK
jgi:hypothetical protein